MRHIGGDNSALFSVTGEELDKLTERVESGQLPAPQRIFREGPAGGNVRFRSLDDATLAKLSIV